MPLTFGDHVMKKTWNFYNIFFQQNIIIIIIIIIQINGLDLY
jgi:hypothetical protein